MAYLKAKAEELVVLPNELCSTCRHTHREDGVWEGEGKGRGDKVK